jgi:Na+/H+-translocating membrane pyrophosphatase
MLPRQHAAGVLEEGVLEARELYSLPVLICGVAAIIFAVWLARDVLSRDSGTPAMQDIASRIFVGAAAFLRRQYSTIAVLAIFVAIIIGLVVGFFEREHQTTRGIITALAFLFGALLSGISGYTGMYIAVRSNSRAPKPGRGTDRRAARWRRFGLSRRRARSAGRAHHVLGGLSTRPEHAAG